MGASSHHMVKVLAVILLAAVIPIRARHWNFTVNLKKPSGPFEHFWKSTGFCPPAPHQEAYKFFLSDDEKQNLALIGSVPRRGIEQVRIHWLLDMVTISTFKEDQPVYNFTLLDELVQHLWTHNMRPGFEIMGNPSNYYKDFENSTQVHQWKDLVQSVAEHFIGIFGLDYVSQWNFETWNEPDNGDFDGLAFTIQGFLNYYDACSEGLKAADPSLKLGGPAGGCHAFLPSSPICWAVLEHCNNGTNYFTNETGVRIDFISFHHKGKGSSKTILDTETETIKTIRAKYTNLAKVPIFNDEGDPLVGWSKPEWWRADTTYAAMVAKIIVQHQHLMITPNPGFHYSLISNDNAFLNYYPSFFDQRTLNARFQMNNTKPHSVQLIKKPVLSVMGLLSKLGDRLVDVEDLKVTDGTDIGILATIAGGTGDQGWSASILICNSADTAYTDTTDRINLKIQGIPSTSSSVYVAYLLDKENGNPHRLWEKAGKPVFPSKAEFMLMRENEEAMRVEGPIPVPKDTIETSLYLKKPGVVFIHICNKSYPPPEKVVNLTLYPVTRSDLLLTWSDTEITSPCILTYEVEHSQSSAGGPFSRVNHYDITFTSFVYSVPESETTEGWFRVRAVDYWSRPGLYSDVIHYSAS